MNAAFTAALARPNPSARALIFTLGYLRAGPAARRSVSFAIKWIDLHSV
jgi:hypothetical protein